MRKLVDRIEYAAGICSGKRVLDIGGQHPLNHSGTHPFGLSYRKISKAAAEYECFDRDNKPNVRFIGDLNTPQGMSSLHIALNSYKPDVILCMEVLEHLNRPCDVMDCIAGYIMHSRTAEAFITIPNNGSWVLNMLGWSHDHNVSFFEGTANRFIKRSELGRLDITSMRCMQKYHWYWWIAYIASFMQPFNWGFHVRKNK